MNDLEKSALNTAGQELDITAGTELNNVAQTVPTGSGGLTTPINSARKRVQQFDAQVPTWGESFGAGFKESTGAKFLGAINSALEDKQYLYGDVDPNFKVSEAMGKSDYVFWDTDYEAIGSRYFRNQNEFDSYVNQLKERDENLQKASNSTTAYLASGLVDPVWITTGMVTGGLGTAFRMSRSAMVATEVAATSAVTAFEMEIDHRLTAVDFAMNAAFAGGFVGVLYRPSKFKDVPSAIETEFKAPTYAVSRDTELFVGGDGTILRNPTNTHVYDTPEGSKATQAVDMEMARDNGQPVNVVNWGKQTVMENVGVAVNGDPNIVSFPSRVDGVTTRYDVNVSTEQRVGSAFNDPIHNDLQLGRAPEATRVGVTGRAANVTDYTPQRVEAQGMATNNLDKHGMPMYQDIKWDAPAVPNSDLQLKDTLFHTLYKNMSDESVNPAIQALARRTLMLTGDRLKSVKSISSPVIRDGKGGRADGVYSPTKNTVRIQKGLDKDTAAFTANHEAFHAVLAHKIDYGRSYPESAHGLLVRQSEDMLAKIRTEVEQWGTKYESKHGALDSRIPYALNSVDEFMSVLTEGSKGSKQLAKFLNDLRVPKSMQTTRRNFLEAIWDSVRQLLGVKIKEANMLAKALGLQENLLKSPEIISVNPDGSISRIRLDGSKSNTMNDLYSAATTTGDQLEASLKETWGKRAGKTLSWNLFKTVNAGSPTFANKWLSDPLGTGNPFNVSSVKRSVHADFDDFARVVKDDFQKALNNRGIGLKDQVLDFNKTSRVHDSIDQELARVLVKRESAAAKGITYSRNGSADIEALADSWQKMTDRVLHVGEESGAYEKGSRVKEGYFPRRYNPNKFKTVFDQFLAESNGDVNVAIKQMAESLVPTMRGTALSYEQKRFVTEALVDRIYRGGENLDLEFRGNMGYAIVNEIRDYMKRQNVPHNQIEDVIDLVTGKVNQAGKVKYMKGRIDLDMDMTFYSKAGIEFKVVDFMETDMLSMANSYTQDAAGRIAMARNGIITAEDLAKEKASFVTEMTTARKGQYDAPMTKQDAVEMFENIEAATLGRPVGEKLANGLRVIRGLTHMVGLVNSGFWQVVEFSKLLVRNSVEQGLGTTAGHLGSLVRYMKDSKDPAQFRQLHNVLSRASWQDTRLQPYQRKLMDGHMEAPNSRMAAFETATDLVYYANGMRYVQEVQSVLASRSIVSMLDEAVKGNTKLEAYFARYGIDKATLNDVKAQMDLHGLEVDRWDQGVWSKIDTPLMTIMDTDVLRARLGEIPAIAQFSQVGKMLFTYRNFVLASHNKIMASELYNAGIKGMSMVLLTQLPLAMLMTQVSSISGGRGVIEDNNKWINAVVAQMGGLGLLAEAYNIVLGSNNTGNIAFLMSVSKASDVLSGFASSMTDGGSFSEATANAAKTIPLISLLPAYKAVVEAIAGGN